MGRKTYVREYAHRIVLWACYGPPPENILDPVAMHVCSPGGRGTWKCLNPEHLVWGERASNLNHGKVERTEARERMLEQRRYTYW